MRQNARGLLTGLDEDSLRDRCAREPYRRLWRRLRDRTREVMKAARDGNFRSLSYGALAWHSITPMVCEAALLCRWEGDEDALHYVEECINAVDETHRETGQCSSLPGAKPPVNSHLEIALAADLCFEGLSSASQERLLALMREKIIDDHQGRKPYTSYAGGGNVAYCQTVNAAISALVWGERCGHDDWGGTVEHAINYTRCYLRYGCDNGGFGYEGTGYSHSVYHYMFLLVQLLKQNGYADLYATEPRLKQLIEASLQLSFPGGGQLINCNDHGLLIPQSMEWLLFTAENYREPLYLGLWYAYQGPDHPRRPYGDVMPWYRREHMPGDMPIDESLAMLTAVVHWDADAECIPAWQADRPTCVYSPGTEAVNLRTSWSENAVYVNVPGAGRSHVSQTHRHADSGHFSIVAHGEYLAIDTGRYNVDEDQHSVVLVDGKCHSPSDGWGMSHYGEKKVCYSSSDLLVYVKVEAGQMKDCYWADRHFLFVPLGNDDCYLIIIDNINKDNTGHSFLWQLQASPDSSLAVNDNHSAVLTGKNNRLDLTFVIPGPEDFPDCPHQLTLAQDVKEWAWPYGTGECTFHENTGLLITSFKRPRLLAEVAGPNCQLLTVVVPRGKDQEALTVTRVPRHRLIEIAVGSKEFTDTVTVALDHGFIETESLKGMTEVAFVRRNYDGVPVACWTENGSDLQVL